MNGPFAGYATYQSYRCSGYRKRREVPGRGMTNVRHIRAPIGANKAQDDVVEWDVRQRKGRVLRTLSLPPSGAHSQPLSTEPINLAHNGA